MKTSLIFILLLPLFCFGQDEFNLPLNNAGTDIVYSQNFAIDSPELHFSKIVRLINKISSENDFRNIMIDSNDLVIFANGTRVFHDINTLEYTFELDYIIAISVKTGKVQISNIYHRNNNDQKQSFGHCYDFKDKTFKAKYYEVINNMQIFIPIKLNDIKKQIDSTILGLMPTQTIVKMKQYQAVVFEKTLNKDDYILKSAESMNNFYKQKRTSHLLGFTGGGLMFLGTAGAFIQQKQTISTATSTIIGSAFILISTIVNIDSYKYIKESSMYLKKSAEGITIGLKF